jgi:HPr kinase/phosphorylase
VDQHEQTARRAITVRELLEDDALGLDLELTAGRAGVDRQIGHTRIQKNGLALVGHHHGVVAHRVQILGETEMSFLERLDATARVGALSGYFGLDLSCVIVSSGGEVPPELVEAAEQAGTPLLVSSARSSGTINALHALLDDRLAPRTSIHGVLVDVFGVGLLMVGASSIGKSECALDLVMRGHRLVADDVVECDYRPPGMVFGQPADLLRYHIEVRGLGILNIKDLFGVTSVRERKRIDIVVRLVEWSADAEYDRMGVDDHYHEILGVEICELTIPVRPGRDMGSILEIAARNQLLRDAGLHGARAFFGRLEGTLMGNDGGENESIAPPARKQSPGRGGVE